MTGSEAWEIDFLGTATVIAPDGAEVTVGARLQWLLSAEQTMRLLLSFDGIPAPVVRLNRASDQHLLAIATVAALTDLMAALGRVSSAV